ncbi:hypothetical protein, partial [Streptococcus suis]
LRKLVQDNRDKKKNTDSTAGFHQNQLESICVFYLLASFCPASLCFLIFGLAVCKTPRRAFVVLMDHRSVKTTKTLLFGKK